MKYGLIGETLGHSLSVPIHKAIGRYEYELCPLPKEQLDAFLTRRDFLGINVTIPYKKAVMDYCEELSPEAQACGAVNTVINRGGALIGHNTDLMGMQALLQKAGISLAGKKVLILGTGGTAGTALALCKKQKALQAELVSRSEKPGCITYAEAQRRTDTQILINTTPCGMFPHIGQSPVDLSFFPHLEGVADAIYNPLKSRLVLAAEAKGIPAAGGLYMLVAQAVYAAEIWTGNDLKDRIAPIYQDLLKQKQNIVLIGMPGCGKSTLGKALAEKLGREFIDTDRQIEDRAGMSVSQIFAEKGEAGFRVLETEIIRSAAKQQGAVIATGGGAVLKEENVELLRANGILVFLDAPVEDLIPTGDRPLSAGYADLRKRYEERYGRYCAVADRRIPATRNLAENLVLLEKETL